VFKALKVSVAILNLTRASIGSQWSLFRVDELESCSKASTGDNTCKGILCALYAWRREMCLAGMP